MVRLQEQLKYFVVKKITTDRLWQGVNVYLSGHEVILCFIVVNGNTQNICLTAYSHCRSYTLLKFIDSR